MSQNTNETHASDQRANPALDLPLLSLSKTIESVLNSAVRLDEMEGQGFVPLEDKVIAVTLSPIKQPLYFLFTESMIAVQSNLEGEADACIQTHLLDFARLPLNRALPNAKFSGDTQLAQYFIDALCALDIDWEEQLSHYTGDLIAFKVGHGVRSLFNTQQGVKDTVSQTLKEFLQFEIEAVPTQSQVKRFCQEVDDITTQTHALEARINTLLTLS